MSETAPPYTTIKPALTPEQWAEALHYGWPDYRYDVIFGGNPENRQTFRHAHAAVALLDQQFGFTREDVALCQLLFKTEQAFGAKIGNWLREEERGALRSLADRIEALLPPEATTKPEPVTKEPWPRMPNLTEPT